MYNVVHVQSGAKKSYLLNIVEKLGTILYGNQRSCVVPKVKGYDGWQQKNNKPKLHILK